MRSGRFTAIADRKPGGERFWTASLWTAIAAVGIVVVVPVLIALGTGARTAEPDVLATEPAPEIESAKASDRVRVRPVPRETAPRRSTIPEPRGRSAEASERRFAEASEQRRLDSVEAAAPSTFAPVAADEALTSAAAAQAPAPSSAPETLAPAAAPETRPAAPPVQPPRPPPPPRGLNRDQRKAWRMTNRPQVPYQV